MQAVVRRDNSTLADVSLVPGGTPVVLPGAKLTVGG